MAPPNARRPRGTPGDPVRSVRISDDVWERARARATREGVTMSSVILSIVTGYADNKVDMPEIRVVYATR